MEVSVKNLDMIINSDHSVLTVAISDVAWSPDNLHFASCSTDSTICIWDVNEHGKSSFLLYASLI